MILRNRVYICELYSKALVNTAYGTMKKPKVSAVVDNILQFIENNHWEIYGLKKSNLHKKIGDALREILLDLD